MIRTNRTPTPESAPFKIGDIVSINHYSGLFVIYEYIAPEAESDEPTWYCRAAEADQDSAFYPQGNIQSEKTRYIFINRRAAQMKHAEGKAEAVVISVEADVTCDLPFVRVSLSGRTFGKYAATPWSSEAFLEELDDAGAVIPDDMHAQIVSACRLYDETFAQQKAG